MELSLLNLLLVLFAAWVAGAMVARLGYPAIFGEIMAGIVLGPPLLGVLHDSEALSLLAEIGVLLMMLYIGMEIDAEELFKASWGGFLAAIGGFVTPFALTYFVVTLLFGGTVLAGLFVGIAAGVTSLATKSRILSDLKLLDTRIAHVMMAGALVADTLSLIAFAGILSFVDVGSLDIGRLAIVGVEVTLFFGATIFTGLKLFPIMWKYLSRWGLANRTFYATFLFLITILFAEFAELAGLHSILGAFLAGLFIREGIGVERRLAGELTELVRDVSIGFLAPIFFVTAGFQVSLEVFSTSLLLLVTVTLVATLGKIAGTAIFYLFSGNGWREGITIGAGMNGRGAVEIIIAQIALSQGILSQEMFSVLVFMAIFTTATVPIFLKWGVDWLKSHGELERPEDERKGVVIVGAGPIARTLAKSLMSPSQPVWIIDNNMDHCKQAESEGLNAIYGNALEEEDLQEAHIMEARWFISLTFNTEVNLLAAQRARHVFSVPEIYVLLTRDEKGALTNMLSEIQATPIYKHDFNVDNLEQVVADLSSREQKEVEISSSMTPDDMLKDLSKSATLSIPLAVTQDELRVPFVAVDKLGIGDKLIVVEAT